MITRRDVLNGLVALPAAVLTSKKGARMTMSPSRKQDPAGRAGGAAPAYRGEHAVVPLPFDPKELRGISERMIVSHHDNNYAAAVKSLNKVEAALAELAADAPPFVVGGLKERQLVFANSKTLHELYFANLGGDGKATGEIAKALAEAYGSFDRWEKEFRATGASLAGGSGWAIVEFELDTQTLRTFWSGNHSQTRANALPLLVMDMYEHAYQMDYGANAAEYVDAFFDNLRWEEVERRFARARAAWKALRG
jgi:Fe-Mn family superoxide dismutase